MHVKQVIREQRRRFVVLLEELPVPRHRHRPGTVAWAGRVVSEGRPDVFVATVQPPAVPASVSRPFPTPPLFSCSPFPRGVKESVWGKADSVESASSPKSVSPSAEVPPAVELTGGRETEKGKKSEWGRGVLGGL